MEPQTAQHKLYNKISVGRNGYYINMADQANLREKGKIIIFVSIHLVFQKLEIFMEPGILLIVEYLNLFLMQHMNSEINLLTSKTTLST